MINTRFLLIVFINYLGYDLPPDSKSEVQRQMEKNKTVRNKQPHIIWTLRNCSCHDSGTAPSDR